MQTKDFKMIGRLKYSLFKLVCKIILKTNLFKKNSFLFKLISSSQYHFITSFEKNVATNF